MKGLIIRRETRSDHISVEEVIRQAFENQDFSDQTEVKLVEKLRGSEAFIPELSIVAELDGIVVGHILLTRLKIKNNKDEFESLGLAPVSVIPRYQRKGIGKGLIQHAHYKARSMGFESVILVGHENYYPRFGYEKASKYHIKLPFEAPDENCMVIELVEDGLKGVSGKVEYPGEFFQL